VLCRGSVGSETVGMRWRGLKYRYAYGNCNC
jgi:hypothetical protein